MPPELDLGRVQRVDGPAPHVVALSVYRRPSDAEAGLREVVVLDARRGVSRSAARPRGDDADGFVRRLRKLLVGSRVHAESREGGPGVRLVLRRGDLDAVLAGEAGAPVLRDRATGKPLAARQRLATRAPDASGWTPFLPPEATAADPAPSSAPATELARALRRTLKRLKRKERAIAADAARAEQAPELRHEAELITAHLGSYVAGTTTLQVLDWSTSPPAPRVLGIDPALGARAQAEALFKRARRFTRGAELAKARQDDVRRDISAVLNLALRVEAAADTEDLTILAHEAAAAGWWQLGSSEAGHGSRHTRPERKSYRTFVASDGGTILVGRSAADNDALTLRVARPHDLWLHARGVRGAHVIVPLERLGICPPGRLIDAATLAAHFSEAAGEAIVEVQHTPRRHVHKRRGLPPGAVNVSREKVLLLRYEEARARALIAREHRT